MNVDSLKKDLLAGAEVALLTVPQAIAYSFCCRFAASCGLFAAVFFRPCGSTDWFFPFFDRRSCQCVSHFSAIGTADILYSHYWEASPLEKEALALEIMVQIALLAGLIQLMGRPL